MSDPPFDTRTADLVVWLRECAAAGLSMTGSEAGRLSEAADAIEYAWSCAEDMRQWALRAEAKLREVREELAEYSTDVGYAAGYEAARERAEAAEAALARERQARSPLAPRK